jgi:hypothetical protein
VLARRVAAAGGSPDGQHWVHEIDLETGKLAGNTLLASAASGIAVDPSGRRVFVALHDRIQSCSTHPITTSWIYRSPGPNGQLAVRPDTGTLCVGRGDEVALFDPAAIAARSAAERHDRLDDATGVVPLPLTVSGLSLSGDGRLAVVQGANRLAFLDCASLALTWASDLPAEVTTAEEIRPLAFPAAGGDLLVAIFPGARVAAIRSPAPVHLPPGHGAQPPVTLEPSQTQAAGPESAGPEAAGPEAVGSAAVAAKPAASPAAGSDAAPEHGPATAATTAPTPPPHAEGPAPHENPPSPVSPPDGPAAAPATAEFLSGEMSGDFKRVQAIVLYGPNNITREFVRVRPAPDGTWRTPLPPPGVYRIVPAGDSAAPLPAAPGFLSVKVEPGKGQNGIDFTILFSR